VATKMGLFDILPFSRVVLSGFPLAVLNFLVPLFSFKIVCSMYDSESSSPNSDDSACAASLARPGFSSLDEPAFFKLSGLHWNWQERQRAGL
jgi:hypothetical protein